MRNSYVSKEDKQNLHNVMETFNRLLNSPELSIIEKAFYEEVQKNLSIISLSNHWRG